MKVAKFLETWLHRPPPFHQVDIKEQVVKKKTLMQPFSLVIFENEVILEGFNGHK
jgi:hypothetical protein